MGERGPIEVRDLRPDEVSQAVGVLARGMRDNPLHGAAYGDDPERRLRSHARLMRGLFRAFPAQQPICAVRGGALVGVTGVAPVGTCQPSTTQRLRLQEHCRRLDASRDVGYLETDKRENVRFYDRFGFEVIGEERVLGVPNWFMRRPPRRYAPGAR